MTTSTSTRAHGTYARYKLDRCRCHDCGYAASLYREDRVKRETAGTLHHDAEPVRRHIRTLQASGMGLRTIAGRAEVERGTLQVILYGRNERGTPPPKRIRYATAQRILAVQPDPGTLRYADATGTWRRVQALCAHGWSLSEIARRIGWTPTNLCHHMKTYSRVEQGTAQVIAALYDRLVAEYPNGPSVPAASRARRHASRQMWFSPAAWDGDTIDDPAALPCLLPATDLVDPGIDEMRIQLFAAGFLTAAGMTWREKAELVRRMADRPSRELAQMFGVAQRSVSTLRSDKTAERAIAAAGTPHP